MLTRSLEQASRVRIFSYSIELSLNVNRQAMTSEGSHTASRGGCTLRDGV